MGGCPGTMSRPGLKATGQSGPGQKSVGQSRYKDPAGQGRID